MVSPPFAHVTAAEISRLAGVTRATVSNWRRRHQDFPVPVAGSDTSPLYDLAAVRSWLESRGQARAVTPVEELRTLLRTRAGMPVATRLLPFVYATARLTPAKLTKLTKLADGDLVATATRTVAAGATDLPVSPGAFDPGDAELLRAVLNGLLDQGGQVVLDALAERELTDVHAMSVHGTPRPLADLMARLLSPDSAAYPPTVFDPACGNGALLDAAGRWGASHLLGQDRMDVQALRSAVHLKLAMPDRATVIKAGDSLRADVFADLRADAVLCNPPFGDRDWGHDELAYDRRWTFGVPPRGESELAWVQHALAHLTPGGHAVLLLPPSTGLRTSGKAIRTDLLKAGALRAVITLPPGAVVPLHIGLHLWVLRRPGPTPSTDPILMIDLTGDVDHRENIDWAILTETVLASWRSYLRGPAAFRPASTMVRAVPVMELFGDNVDLTPVRHLHRAKPDPAAASRQARSLLERLSQSLDAFSVAATSRAWADTKPGTEARTWRTATVSDLAKGGLLTILRPARDTSDDPLPEEHLNRLVLTGRDVASGGRATGATGDGRVATPVVVEPGDVLLPKVASRERVVCRVADADDAGCLLGTGVSVLRVDPARLDPWFLAGFLVSEENMAATTRPRQDILLDPRRLRVPLLPLEEQRRYGTAFRDLHRLEQAARHARDLVAETTRAVSTALTEGALAPPVP